MKKLFFLIIVIIVLITFVACNSNGSQNVGDTINFGGIEWSILNIQDGKALIISNEIIVTHRYNNKDEAVTWETCDLREYLNEEFYYSFKEADRAKIFTVTNINPDNPWFGTAGGNDTQDNIFLLSLEEVVKYFGDSGQLQNGNPEDDYRIDDEYNEARIEFERGDLFSSSWWWLRTPGSSSGNAVAVDHADYNPGYILVRGTYVDRRGDVRPALWLKLE